MNNHTLGRLLFLKELCDDRQGIIIIYVLDSVVPNLHEKHLEDAW